MQKDLCYIPSTTNKRITNKTKTNSLVLVSCLSLRVLAKQVLLSSTISQLGSRKRLINTSMETYSQYRVWAQSLCSSDFVYATSFSFFSASAFLLVAIKRTLIQLIRAKWAPLRSLLYNEQQQGKLADSITVSGGPRDRLGLNPGSGYTSKEIDILVVK